MRQGEGTDRRDDRGAQERERPVRDGAATAAAVPAERLLTLTLRHRDLHSPDDVLQRFASDLGEALDARVTARCIDDAPPLAGAVTTLRVVVRGDLVAFLDLVRYEPPTTTERNLLIQALRLLGDRLTQVMHQLETRLLAELTDVVSSTDGMLEVSRRALEVIATHVDADAGALLLLENDRFDPLARSGAWARETAGVAADDATDEMADMEAGLDLARASLRADDPLIEDERLVACRLGSERPHRYVLLLRYPEDLDVHVPDLPSLRLPSFRRPALRQATGMLAPHLAALWREEVRETLLAFHDGSWDHTTAEMYQRLLDVAIRLAHGADSGSLLVRRSIDEPFVYQAIRGFDAPSLHGIVLSANQARAWYGADDPGWDRGRPRVIRADTVDIGERSVAATPQLAATRTVTDAIRATLCLPVLHEGAVMAFLNLDNQHDAGAFGRDSRDVIAQFGPPVAGVLHRQHTQDLLRKAAMTDPLTGLNNRRPFAAALTRELARHDRTGAPLSVLVMDLSGFKAINDELGHDEGDAALIRVADALRLHVRDGDVLARRGGDEFAAILVGTTAEAAADAAARLSAAVAGIDMRGRSLTINIGSATAPGDGTSEQELMTLADRRMYEAKRVAGMGR